MVFYQILPVDPARSCKADWRQADPRCGRQFNFFCLSDLFAAAAFAPALDVKISNTAIVASGRKALYFIDLIESTLDQAFIVQQARDKNMQTRVSYVGFLSIKRLRKPAKRCIRSNVVFKIIYVPGVSHTIASR